MTVSPPRAQVVAPPRAHLRAQVMSLQLHWKVQKMNLTQRKLAKMLFVYSLFCDGVWISDMDSQARETICIGFGHASLSGPAPPIFMADLCVYQGFARLKL